jgi:hypothetical protein
VGECALDKKEQGQDVQQSLHAWIGEAQRCRALVKWSTIAVDSTIHG